MDDPEPEEMEANGFLRDTIMSLHRASMNRDENVRMASLNSLVEMASDADLGLIVVQTWLEQFARVNGGNVEYCGDDRVRLLRSMMTIADNLMSNEDARNGSNAFRAAVGRAVSLAVEEMTRTTEVIEAVQLPCSKILVRLGSRKHVDRIMDAVLSKFQPGATSHFYVLATLSELAISNPTHVVPFLKAILGTMLATMKSVKKDQLRFAYANALSRFSEAILDYLANIDAAPDPTVTKEHFVTEIDAAHEILFNGWLNGKGMTLTPKFEAGAKVKNAVIEALGFMAPLLSDERLYRNAASPICSTLLGMYKKVPEPFFLTQCLCNLLNAMLERDVQLVDAIAEPLFTALFVQVCQFSASSSDLDSKRRNHYEVLRTYDLLIRSHPEKLVTGLLLRLNSVDENIRVSALIVFKHLINSSMDVLSSRMSDLLTSLHARLSETSNRVRKMLAQIVALLASLGYLEADKGTDFLEFIVKLCALPEQPVDGGGQPAASDLILNYLTSDYNGGSVVTNSSLKDMCDNILMLLTKEATMEAVLWPKLVDYLLAPDFAEAEASLVKSLAGLSSKATFNQEIDYEKLKHVQGPYDLFARLIVLASKAEKADHVLAFMLSISGLINKHLSALWAQRIPLLQHYLENTKIKTNQGQWEEWLLGLLDDTLTEVDLDEWTVAFSASLNRQMVLYPEDDRSFLFKAIGQSLKKVKASNRGHIGDLLASVFNATNHNDDGQSEACALAFGHVASSHLGLVLEKLEALLKADFGRRTTSFFSFMRTDTKVEDIQRCTILKAVGATRLASKADLEVKADEMCQKFIMPAMQSASGGLKMAALKATSDLASALNGLQDFQLAHHSDLIHEAIECMKAKSWSLADKHVALITTLELVKLPPFVSQLTRCSILKACFTAVFPNLIRQPPNEAVVEAILTQMLSLVRALLLQELRQSTLDEIFTLIEPYLKLAEKASRQMAMTVLHATLKTFLSEQKAEIEAGEEAFAPGPYIMASLVPRCFDSSIWVTSTALASLQVMVKICRLYVPEDTEMTSIGLDEDLEAGIMALERISASCSPLTVSSYHKSTDPDGLDDPEVSPGLVASTIVNVLKLVLASNEVLPLVHSLIDGLGDECPASARGVSLVLTAILEVRGHEVKVTTSLLPKLHAMLASGAMQEDTRSQTLMAVRILTSHNKIEVVEAFLNEQQKLPFDRPLAEMWRALTKEKTLAVFILNHLLDNLRQEAIIIEEKDKITFKTKKIAHHLPLASIHALKICFEVKEMEAIVDHAEFADVFVPILMAKASYAASDAFLAEAAASEALTAFLASKGCQSAANIVEAKSDDHELIASLTEAICLDFPMYLPKLVLAFKAYPSMNNEHLVVAASFYAQLILTTEANLDHGLHDIAVSTMLEYLMDHREGHAELRIVCLHGLSALSLDTKKANTLKEFSPSILKAIMDTIGDDFDATDVNFNALLALENLLSTLNSEMMTSDLTTSIVTKISPFFDGGHKRDAAAAMKVFSKLASKMAIAPEAEKAHFCGLVHQVMVSLLLHLNGDDDERPKASMVAISDSLAYFAASTASKALLSKKPLNYCDFLREFCRNCIGADDADMYVDKALSYFRINESRLRGNAVILLTSLIVDGNGIDYGRNHAEVICASVSRLLGDGLPEVQAAAASSLGKVCIALSKSS